MILQSHEANGGVHENVIVRAEENIKAWEQRQAAK